jgi:RND family efflux transporter MFP subunit
LEQLQNAKTALELSTQQLKATKFNQSYSEIHAAKDGYVLKKLANEGQVVSSGTAVFQTNGAQSGNWLLRVGMSDKEWAAIQINDNATITTAAAAGQEFSGKVFRKSEGADAASGSFTVDIKLTGNKPNAIAAGMFGKAVIQTSAVSKAGKPNTWAIPYDALLDGDGTTGYVFTTNDNKTAHKQKVGIAEMDKNNVIINDGLQSAKSIIISGSAYLTDNSPIRVIQQP